MVMHQPFSFPYLTKRFLAAEYIWNYMFYQDGNIELEIRLTGIVQVYAEDPAAPSTSPFATTVARGVQAQHHQHMFSVRLDPMVDGLANTVVETDIVPVDAPTGSAQNHAGNGFTTQSRPVATAAEGARDFELATDRRWSVVNPRRAHPVTGKPPGYTIMGKGGVTPLMARDDSWVARRARWAQKATPPAPLRAARAARPPSATGGRPRARSCASIGRRTGCP